MANIGGEVPDRPEHRMAAVKILGIFRQRFVRHQLGLEYPAPQVMQGIAGMERGAKVVWHLLHVLNIRHHNSVEEHAWRRYRVLHKKVSHFAKRSEEHTSELQSLMHL